MYMKRIYVKPALKALAIEQESLLDVISGGTGEGTNNSANAKAGVTEESSLPRYSVWDDGDE